MPRLKRPSSPTTMRSALIAVTALAAILARSPPAGAAMQPLPERRLADRVPLDDPSLSPRANPAPAPATPPLSGSYLGAAIGASLDTMAWTATALANLPDATGQFLWEISYMLGVNRAPVQPPQPGDPALRPGATVSPVDPPRAASGASTSGPSTSGRTDRDAPGQDPIRTVADDAPPITKPPVPPSPAMPIGPQDEIDHGLIANLVYDRSYRREDGTYFVPKPLQRLFNVRTQAARRTDVPTVTRVAGRIVPDPSMHGTVQPSVPGRLEPPETGFPSLGQTVKQGQVLALVTPSIGVVDLTQVRRDVTKLTNDIRLETESLEILRQFSWVPFREGKIYQAEQRVAGLRRERETLLPMLELRESLRAPTDGVVSATTAVNGRIVQPGEVVFDIIDPSRMWVEATAPDPATAEQARGAPVAAAETPEGINLVLRFVGTGLSATRQATPILFSIDHPPAGLRVGRPVTVTVINTAQSQRGVLVNRSAVTQGSSGIEEVWEQTAPEIFVPHAVRTHVIDGASVLVTDGLQEGARIVINGSRLMAQLQ